MKQKIQKILEKEGKELLGKRVPLFFVEVPSKKDYGDYFSNIAFVIAKEIKKSSLEIANILKEKIEKERFFKRIEVVPPGFINFFLKENYFRKELKNILKKREEFGKLKIGKNKKVNIEFISANPTGPLTLGNGRGGFAGDVLANVFQKAGFKVVREYYINDTGNQIKTLGYSLLGDERGVYKGEYIEELKEELKVKKEFKEKDAQKLGEVAAKKILEKMIKPSIKKMGIKFDIWFSERSLYKNKEIEKVLQELSKRGFIYEKDGALWFKSHQFGDEKDRVLVKSDGSKTYFTSDVAYLKNKFERSFDKMIILVGADHFGYAPRIKAAAKALGLDDKKIDFIIMQLVRVFEKGKEVRMSKRKGIFITIDELIEMVGLDVVRFFFLMVKYDTHLNFNLDLAKERSEKNPVFKIQYAYARICSILKKAGAFKKEKELIKANLELLKETIEMELIKKLIRFPELIEEIVKNYQVHIIAHYALDLAETFHRFYEKCQVIDLSDFKLTKARLALLTATKIILKNVLDLMGISALEKM